jgi:hypothetical protein
MTNLVRVGVYDIEAAPFARTSMERERPLLRRESVALTAHGRAGASLGDTVAG